MSIKSIIDLANLELESRRVLVRLDLDVPLTRNIITDDAKIRYAIPTITYLREQGARIIIASHLGKPDGRVVKKLSMESVAAHLAQEPRFDEVFLTDSCVGDGARSVIQGLREGQICVLENLAFHAGELTNDDKLARQLASFCDVYLNDAFSIADRLYASTAAITRHARTKTLGPQFAKEFSALSTVLAAKERPFVWILGGDALAPNLGMFENLLPKLDTLVLTGKIANTFIAATGGNTGDNPIETDKLPLARDIINRTAAAKIKVVLPIDLVAGASDNYCVYPAQEIPPGIKTMDIGPASINAIEKHIKKAGTILWSGQVGTTPKITCQGNSAVASAVAASAGFSLALGQQTAAAVRKTGKEIGFDWLSFGGTTALKLLEGKTLPIMDLMRS